MKYRNTDLKELSETNKSVVSPTLDGNSVVNWVPARPHCIAGWVDRLEHAFGVITGKYDVIDWGEEK